MEVILTMMEERGVLARRVLNAKTMLEHVMGCFVTTPTDSRAQKVTEKAIDYRKRFEELVQYDNDQRNP